MKLKIQYILLMMAAAVMAACSGDVEMTGVQQGRFTLGLSTDGMNVEVETRVAHELTASEAADYNVTLVQGGDTMWTKRFAEITEPDRTQPLAEGYVVSAENCTKEDAEASNAGWGQRRFAGESEPFDIVSGITTPVVVNCSMQNAGLGVVFDESFTSFFSEYAVTTDDSRALKFNATNDGIIAYYNTDETGVRTVDVIISASAGWDGTARLQRTLTLEKGKTMRLRVRKGAPQEGNIGLSINTSDFDEQGDEEVVLE